MDRLISTEIRSFSLSSIDPEDRTYALSPAWKEPTRILASVRRAGLLSPLHIQESPKGTGIFRLVDGFQRFAAARQLGLDTVPCIEILQPTGLQLFEQTLEAKLSTRDLLDLERALAVLRLTETFSLPQEQLIDRFLPLLGIRPDRFHLRRFLELARLPEPLQRALPELDNELALRAAEWHQNEQELLVRLIGRYRPGKNKQKSLFTLLEDLRAAGRQSEPVADLTQIWVESGAAQADTRPECSPPERFREILQRLTRRRFPVLLQQQLRSRDLKASLRIPPQIQLNLPPYFEGERISVQFSVRNPEELKNLSLKLAEIADKKELVELFELL